MPVCRQPLSPAQGSLLRVATLLLSALYPAGRPAVAQAPEITHGVAVGDVTSTSALVWSRSSRAARMHVEVNALASSGAVLRGEAEATPAADRTAQVRIDGLQPASTYIYRVWFETTDGRRSDSSSGFFRTSPAANDSDEVRFIWSGDLGGQRYCRHVDRGYEIFAHMARLEPDFFVANGDMIYADNDCPAQGPGNWRNVPGDFPSVAADEVDWQDYGALREAFLGHWRYNRADSHFQRFTAAVPMYVQWDDHEVINDFGAAWPSLAADESRAGYTNLVRAGLTAFFDFHPISRSDDDRFRIYRSFSWGREVDLAILDARSYRSPNALPDTPENAKTLLGSEQVAWLKGWLETSQATWKIISSDVPLSVPTGGRADVLGSDAWAAGARDPFSATTGFESELGELLRVADRLNVRNLVFITTDVHFAAQIRYQVDADGDGDDIVFHELIAGPLNAVRAATPPQLDPTLNPVVLYAEGNIFNFGYVRVERGADGSFHLLADVRDEEGRIRPGSELRLEATP